MSEVCALTAPRDRVIAAFARLKLVPYTREWQAASVALTREMHAESLLHRDMPINEAKLVSQFEMAITRPDAVYLKLCVRGDEVMGFFLGFVSSMFFSDTLTAKDLMWFVSKSRRGSLAAVLLLGDFEVWAQQRGVHHITLGQSTGVRISETRALYSRLGYSEIGSNNVKRI